MVRVAPHLAPLVTDRVASHVDTLPGLECRLPVRVECGAGDPDEDRHHSQVDDVPAVAPAVLVDEPAQRRPRSFPVLPPSRRDTAPELLRDRRDHEDRQRKGNERVAVRHAGEREERSRHEREGDRPEEHRSEVVERRAPPGDERPDPRESEENQPHRHIHLIEPGRPHGDLHAAHRLADHREHRSPQDREAGAEKDQVVQQEGRLPRDVAVQRRFAAQRLAPDPVEDRDEHRHEDDVEEEPGADPRLGERVHALDHPAPGDERADERQEKGQGHEKVVPELHHVALLLDHHRVQVRRPGEPGHERRVLHRVPGPVAAPAELHVGPPPAQQDPDREEEPGEEHPAARAADPRVVQTPGDERRHREGEGDRQSHVAQVEARRVDHHRRVLEQRVEAPPVMRNVEARKLLEGARDEEQEEDEEEDVRAEHRHDVGRQIAVARAVLPCDAGRVERKDPHPEEQRSFLPRPERRDRVVPGEGAVGVVGDVPDGEVVDREGVKEHHDGQGQ